MEGPPFVFTPYGNFIQPSRFHLIKGFVLSQNERLTHRHFFGTCVGYRIATASLQVQTFDALKSVPARRRHAELQWPARARMQDKGRACGKKRTTHTRTPREFIFALGHKPPPDKALELLSVVTRREPKIYMQHGNYPNEPSNEQVCFETSCST